MENLNEMLKKLDSVLSNVDLKDVDSESTGYEELPDGYYLCGLEKADLKESKSSHEPMVAIQFSVIENGIKMSDDEDSTDLEEIKGTKGRKIFLYYVLKDERSVKRFATDMLKFEDENQESILPKEAFMTSETLEDALDVIQGMYVYVQISTTVKEEGSSTWRNLISWKRAAKLGLPM